MVDREDDDVNKANSVTYVISFQRPRDTYVTAGECRWPPCPQRIYRPRGESYPSKMPSPSLIHIPHQSSLSQLKMPKTPAGEGITFFESSRSPGEEFVRVYELQLDPDGGPSKERAVRTQY
jgi:hypothetical protein